MKVVCISDNVSNELFDKLSIGSIYTVIDENTYMGKHYYQLENLETGKDGFIEFNQWYLSNLFAPLSQIDETTFERNYNTQAV